MMKKIIVFDLLCAQPTGNNKTVKFHGGGEYTKTIFKALMNQNLEGFNVLACFNTNEFIDEWITHAIDKNHVDTVNVSDYKDIVKLINSKADAGNSVVFFSGMIYPYRKDTLSISEKVKSIGTCHGLRTLEKPYDDISKYYCSNFKQYLIDLSKKTVFRKKLRAKYKDEFIMAIANFSIIITDSLHSKYSIVNHLSDSVDSNSIKVYYAPMKVATSDVVQSDKKYIMLISADRWLKNSYRGVLALDNLYAKNQLKVKTKVFGNFPQKLINKLKCPNSFEFLGYVESDELEKAYANCTIFFYPTLNEGFGLPPLEAMKYNKTCVISAVCSLPEIYNDSVYYCNPYDIGEMENRILMALERPISSEVIKKRVEYITKRQDNDLKELISLIIC